MLTVTQLARGAGLSRTAVLYYESIGLLKASARSGAGYRLYGERDIRRLRQILVYRDAGLKLTDIRALLDRPENEASGILERRLAEIAREIERLRAHQGVILRLLRHKRSLDRRKDMTKDKWVAIMKAAGFTEADMHRWHAEFEKAAPEDHQEFLEYLHIPAQEIGGIRAWSRKPTA
ncbi:MAG TPA: MerR family transcriptional regulator [Solibacterales bacterium]|nr:MerR family transcriptional regulator [Bryobacterales bacterium]